MTVSDHFHPIRQAGERRLAGQGLIYSLIDFADKSMRWVCICIMWVEKEEEKENRKHSWPSKCISCYSLCRLFLNPGHGPFRFGVSTFNRPEVDVSSSCGLWRRAKGRTDAHGGKAWWDFRLAIASLSLSRLPSPLALS